MAELSSSKLRVLPSWEHCAEQVKAGTATALEAFIHDNEPADVGIPGAHTEAEFRAGLLAVLNQARGDWEAEPRQCAKCTAPETGCAEKALANLLHAIWQHETATMLPLSGGPLKAEVDAAMKLLGLPPKTSPAQEPT
jgi:hypothetical protein